MLPIQVFWPGEFYGLYSPWVTKSQTRLSKFHFLLVLSIQKGGCCFLLLWLFWKTHNSDCSEKIIILFTCMGWNWNKIWKQEKKKIVLAFSYMSVPFSSAIANFSSLQLYFSLNIYFIHSSFFLSTRLFHSLSQLLIAFLTLPLFDSFIVLPWT